MNTNFFKYTFLLVVLGASPWAYATKSLSYSGRLVTPTGAPVTGPVDLRVELGYTTPSGMGPVLCRQDLSSVSLSSGVFHIKIDPDCFPMTFSQVLSSTPDNETLAIKVTDLTAGKTYSYQALHSIPYAHFSQSAKQLVQMDATSGQVLRWNGSAWTPSDESGTGDGTITQINTGAGLSGGPITTSGTISIEMGGIQDGHLAGNINPSKLAGTRDGSKYLKGDNSWSTFMTDVLATILNGYIPVEGSNVTSADSIFQAMRKLDNQIAGKLDKTGGTLSVGTIDGVPDPVSLNQVANKAYVDSKVGNVNSSQWIDVAPNDIQFSTGKVGIGTSAPTEQLDVVGNIALKGNLRIQSNNLNYVEFKAPSDAVPTIYELPKAKGTAAGQALITDINGKLSWGSASADTASLADDSIALTKVAGLTSALNSKENNLPSDGTDAHFLNGLKKWINLDTSAVPENGNLYYKDSLARSSISTASPSPLSYNSATGVLDFTAPGLSGNVLKSDGSNWVSGAIVAGDLPSFDAVKITSGVLPIERGGTGASSFNGGRIVLSTPTALIESPSLSNGQLLIGSTGNAPIAANLSAGAGVDITNSAGGIIISAIGSGGTVTNVTGSAPLTVINNTSIPDISISKSNSTTDGYLSSTDWNTFSNKLGTDSSFSGDVSGTASTLSVDRIKNSPILLSAPTSGNLLRFDGTNWVNAMLGTVDITTGILPISRGGTNSGVALANNRIMVSSGGSIVEAGALTDRQILIGKTGLTPETRTLTAGSGVSFDDTGAGVFEISATGSGGTVTSVSVGAPLSILNNTTTPAISLPKATTAVDGYLSAIDWTTFNNKQNALVNGATINGIVYPALPTQSLQIPLAPVNLTDAVNKQYVDTQVSGAANQWGQSGGNVYRTAGLVGIGTSTPYTKLDIEGGDVAIRGSTYPGLYIKNSSKADGTYGRTWAWMNYANGLYLNGYAPTGTSLSPGSPINGMFVQDTTGNVGIGTSTPTEKLHVNGKVLAVAYEYTSDARLKENIQLVSSPLEKVSKLEGVTFDWRHDEYPERNMPKGRTYGFIAQDVEKHVPELVSTGKDGFKSVQYGNITALLVESIKELFNYSKKESEERKILERKIASLEEQNHKLQNEVDAIKVQHAKDMEELRRSILEMKKK